jgi:hypothetical protein
MLRLAALLAGLALLAGCGGDDEAPAGSSATLAEPITFEVIGGDAFRDDELTVEPDGSVTIQTRAGDRTADLSEAELAEVAAHAEHLGDAESALTEPPQPDALSYRFTYRGEQVETDSGALPDDLAPMVGTFIALIDRYGPA